MTPNTLAVVGVNHIPKSFSRQDYFSGLLMPCQPRRFVQIAQNGLKAGIEQHCHKADTTPAIDARNRDQRRTGGRQKGLFGDPDGIKKTLVMPISGSNTNSQISAATTLEIR
jgi:hypothetical protein